MGHLEQILLVTFYMKISPHQITNFWSLSSLEVGFMAFWTSKIPTVSINTFRYDYKIFATSVSILVK